MQIVDRRQNSTKIKTTVKVADTILKVDLRFVQVNRYRVAQVASDV